MVFNSDDWTNSLTLTISGALISGTLTDFPVLIMLSSGTGITNFDVTTVFDELGSNSKKIAITSTVSGVETELYTEIEKWDSSAEEASLWTKVPTIASGTNTILNFYYDSSNVDNTSYIGDTDSAIAQNVWPDNTAVYHMNQDPSAGASSIKDSTSSNLDMTPDASMTSEDLVDSMTGKAIDLDGSNDDLNVTGSYTDDMGLLILVKFDTVSPVAAYRSVAHSSRTGTNTGLGLILTHSASRVHPAQSHATDKWMDVYTYNNPNYGYAVSQDTWYLFLLQKNGANIELYVNGNLELDLTYGAALFGTGVGAHSGFVVGDLGGFINGQVAEVRTFSSKPQTAAWVKANYHNMFNELVTFSPGKSITYYFDGYVTVRNQSATRQLNLHRRDTGSFIGSTTSSGAEGYYYIETTHTGTHYLVCFDDAIGEDFNDLIRGNILPYSTV